jgi:hypothetical protein
LQLPQGLLLLQAFQPLLQKGFQPLLPKELIHPLLEAPLLLLRFLSLCLRKQSIIKKWLNHPLAEQFLNVNHLPLYMAMNISLSRKN